MVLLFEKDVLSKAAHRAAMDLGLSQKELAGIIGNDELVRLFLCIYGSLNTLVGGSVPKARLWFCAYNDHLAGVPRDLVQTAAGLARVAQYLDGLLKP